MELYPEQSNADYCERQPTDGAISGLTIGGCLPRDHIATCTQWFELGKSDISCLTRKYIGQQTGVQVTDLKLEDHLQNAFVAMLQKKVTPFETFAKFKVWIATCAKNSFINDFRQYGDREGISLEGLRAKVENAENKVAQREYAPEDYRDSQRQKAILEAEYWELFFAGISQLQANLSEEHRQIFDEAYLLVPRESRGNIAKKHNLERTDLSRLLAKIRGKLDKILLTLGMNWRTVSYLRQSSIFELAREKQLKKQKAS